MHKLACRSRCRRATHRRCCSTRAIWWLPPTFHCPPAAIDTGAHALNPRGELYTKDSIRERLSMRNFMDELRGSGVEKVISHIVLKDAKRFSGFPLGLP